MTARKPSSEPLTIALTPGDPAGIGPEIVLRAASDPALARVCELIILGNRRILERAARTLNGPPARGVRDRLTGLHVQEAGRSGGRKFEWGDLSAAAGRFSYECVEAGVRLVRSGRADALVTAPISKRAWELAGGVDRSPLLPCRREEAVTEFLTFPSPTVTWHAILTAMETLLGRA
ncbi:MAG: 4-hydroxythreonine-4-phosphate dehydrogenase PdxA, partial [Nitrospinota bacterium]|nr:4-hydroxythreonine-4-phosphate dehydrogenase PdxA [Nitrospinota bacterium]